MSENRAKRNLLELRGIRKSFGGNVVLASVTVSLSDGDIVLLKGANGSGKTTLLNVISGNLKPDAGTIALGSPQREFIFPRRGLQRLQPSFLDFAPEKLAFGGLGRTWQGIRLFKTLTLAENIEVAAQTRRGRLCRRPSSMFWRRLENFENNVAGNVALPVAKAVALERVIRTGAEILLLDEPLSGLDSHGAIDAIEQIRSLVASSVVKAVVVIEHDMNISVFKGIANRVWNLREGCVFEESPAVGLISNNGDISEWLNRIQTGGYSADWVSLPKDAGIRVCSFATDSHVLKSRALLAVNQVNIKTTGGLMFNTPISFTLNAGDLAVLFAPNGWGKTTLLAALAGETALAVGDLHINGKNANGLDSWGRARCGLRFSKVSDFLFQRLTVRENLKLAGAAEVVTPDMLKPMLDRAAGSLSGGEARMLGFVCAVNSPEHNVILLDEPFSAVDSSHVPVIRSALETAASRGKTVLLTAPVSVGVKRDTDKPLEEKCNVHIT